MGRLGRILFEYVGNLNPSHDEEPEPPPALADRRTNRRDRELMDWIKGQMEERGFPVAQEQQFLDDLREAIRQGGTPRGVASTIDATADRRAPKWVPEENG